ncbi:MAG: pyroglutamyl-peptidase I [Lachnospiraceae bacterium]|nr:pyroglutamyl-peptidase I [Lachnospiraceae bacterium]
MAQKTILITGYEPFGGDTFNPSLALAEKLDGENYKAYEFNCVKIPVNRHLCIPTIERAIEKYQPEIVICTGLAYGRAGISIERIAINVADFPWPDNEGYLALNEAIDEKGPAAYWSTLPIRAIMNNIREAGVPAYISNSAGTYCCNLLMYGVLNYISGHNLNIKAGMMHVPYTPEMAIEKDFTMPTMSLENMVKAVRTAAIAAIETDKDDKVICGFAQ